MAMGKIYLAAPRKTNKGGRRRPRATIVTSRRRFLPKYTPCLLPKTMKIKLRYAFGGTTTLTSTGGALNSAQYALNGLYDTYISGTGGQPRGFDEIMALYRNYTVIGYKAVVKYGFDGTTSTHYSGECHTHISPDPTAPATYRDVIESRFRKSSYLSPNNQPVVHVMQGSVSKLLGVPHPMSDNELKGNVGANPTTLLYMNIMFNTNIAENQSVEVRGWIDFTSVFTEPNLPGAS